MKGANIETAGSGSFWKQAHHFALTETTLHLLGDRPDGVAIAPFDKDRTGSRHQPSNHRPAPDLALGDKGRSEEHTSELQSLMRISYAVCGLKKKNHRHDQHIQG